MRPSRVILAAGLITAVVVYAPSLTHQFVYEDARTVENVPVTISMLISSLWAMVTGHQRAGTTFSVWIVSYLAGFNPAAHHAMNLALHLANGWLVYLVAITIMPKEGAAIAASLFLVHPVNTQAVNYLGARGDLVATLGILGTLAYGLRGRWVFAGLCAGAAILGKESAIVALPLWAWMTYRTRQSKKIIKAVACLSPLLLVTILRTLSYGELQDNMVMSRGPIGYALLQIVLTARALRLFLWPVGFTVDYDVEIVSPEIVGLVVVGFLAALILAWRYREEFPWALTALGFVVIALSPRYVTRFSEYLNEHQFYTPLIGVELAAGAVLCRLPGLVRRPARVVAHRDRVDRSLGAEPHRGDCLSH